MKTKMKNILKIIMVLSVFSQVSMAQHKETNVKQGLWYQYKLDSIDREVSEKNKRRNEQLSVFQSPEEYKLWYDSIVPKLKEVEKHKDKLIDIPFSDFVKFLNSQELNIDHAGLIYNDRKVYPEVIDGLRLYFFNKKKRSVVIDNRWNFPFISLQFKSNKKPFVEALLLFRKYEATFNDEVLKMFSDSQIESIEFFGLDGAYREKYKPAN
jgi:hypothetical protein